VQGFFLLLLLFFAFYQFSLPLKTYARMLFLLFQQALFIASNIKNDTSAFEDTGTAIFRFDLCRA
jgi:hypothetical protein